MKYLQLQTSSSPVYLIIALTEGIVNNRADFLTLLFLFEFLFNDSQIKQLLATIKVGMDCLCFPCEYRMLRYILKHQEIQKRTKAIITMHFISS